MTSALDTATEQHVQSYFEKLLRDRTSFVIAHRLATVRTCDRIVVLDNGAIAQVGTHKHLIEKPGIYQNLWLSNQSELD